MCVRVAIHKVLAGGVRPEPTVGQPFEEVAPARALHEAHDRPHRALRPPRALLRPPRPLAQGPLFIQRWTGNFRAGEF